MPCDGGDRYVWDGFTCWDVVAAASVARPDLFGFEEMDVTLNERLFHVGYLEHARPGAPSARIRIPRIKDAHVFKDECIAAWRRALAELPVG